MGRITIEANWEKLKKYVRNLSKNFDRNRAPSTQFVHKFVKGFSKSEIKELVYMLVQWVMWKILRL